MSKDQFSVFYRAGIGPGVLAKLMGVSRVTASQWVNGHAEPHRLLKERVDSLLTKVNYAVSHGRLPLATYPGRARLFEAISKVLSEA